MDKREHRLEYSCDTDDSVDTSVGGFGTLFQFLGDYSWTGVEPKRYKSEDGSWLAVTRFEIVKGKEIHFRYFEVSPGGYSTLEKHEHEHIVMCLRGRGKVVAGSQVYEMKPYDVIHIKSWTPHQFIAEKEPFGFICVVPANRDRPKRLTDEEVEELLRKNPSLRDVIRR